MIWTGRDLERMSGGRLVSGAECTCTGVSTDTRTIRPGELFVPIVGDRFDGHDFLDRAAQRECCGALVSASWAQARGVRSPLEGTERVQIEVPDTLYALGELARAHLADMPARIIGITGSNGKTSTKELTAVALAPYGTVTRNQGNFNNRIGLPLSAFSVSSEHDFCVLEMGMSEPGEIARLTEIAEPEVGLITSVAAAHLSGVGSLEGVARAKGELFAGLGPDAVAVANLNDPRVRRLADELSRREGAPRLVGVGGPGSDVAVAGIRRAGVAGLQASITIDGRPYRLELRSLGEHDVWNAALAIGVVAALGLNPRKAIDALAQWRGVPGRLQWKVTPDGVNVIDDSYNANPASVRAALRTLIQVGRDGVRPGRRIAVLGDMLELGDDAAALHEEIGTLASDLDVDLLLACGELRSHLLEGYLGEGNLGGDGHVVSAADAADLLEPLRHLVKPGDWVLIKGSRGMRMERLVRGLLGGDAA